MGERSRTRFRARPGLAAWASRNIPALARASRQVKTGPSNPASLPICAARVAAGACLAVAFQAGQDTRFEVAGRVAPDSRAAVTLHGATSPFSATTVTGLDGRYGFRQIEAGTYTLSAYIPGKGETRRTIEVGPGVADARGRVIADIDSLSAKFSSARRGTVSARELSVPDKARREYENAQKRLGRRDIPGAIAHLNKAVEMAPQFTAAWNNLGTIAYQTKRFDDAERYFRAGLEQDPGSFEPLVNLGGVLVTLGKIEEALKYNLYAVLARPEDALANSQLGTSYFGAGNLDLARKYLEIAVRLDPAHFSHPQLLLAEIHLRQSRPADAASAMEDFLRHHPDWPAAEKMREAIQRLRVQ